VRIERFVAANAARWDAFVRGSKNGTFQFERRYMDYHADRYRDHSLMVFSERDRLVALLPAHEVEHAYISHGGLSFGGFVTDESMTTPMMLSIFEAIRHHLATCGFNSWRYKTVPGIYHRYPADEDRYALFRCGAELYRVDTLSTIAMHARPPLQERRRRRIRAARRLGLQTARAAVFGQFWALLEGNLASRRALRPVHSLDEIERLHSHFPDAIKLHVCTEDQAVVAGIVIYDTPTVAHAQYSAASPRGMQIGALDALIEDLIENEYKVKPYFDLGSSTECESRVLNQGLIEYKEGFGARTVAHEFFEVPLP
jgi:hypothetical protein